jgi:hypothetical protein
LRLADTSVVLLLQRSQPARALTASCSSSSASIAVVLLNLPEPIVQSDTPFPASHALSNPTLVCSVSLSFPLLFPFSLHPPGARLLLTSWWQLPCNTPPPFLHLLPFSIPFNREPSGVRCFPPLACSPSAQQLRAYFSLRRSKLRVQNATLALSSFRRPSASRRVSTFN